MSIKESMSRYLGAAIGYQNVSHVRMPDYAFSNLDSTDETLRGDLEGTGVKMHPVTANRSIEVCTRVACI